MSGGFGQASDKGLCASEEIPFARAVALVSGDPDSVELAGDSGEAYGVAEQGNLFYTQNWQIGAYVPVSCEAGRVTEGMAGTNGFTDGDNLCCVTYAGFEGAFETAGQGAKVVAIARATATAGMIARIEWIGTVLHET